MGITELILDIAKQEGVESGLKKGLQQGAVRERKQVVEEISRNLLRKGLDIQLIHEATTIPIKQLEKLKKELLVRS